MAYDLATLPWKDLLAPVAAATAALARLDARLAGSPVRAGFLARQDFADAAAALWLAGELVHTEDLVLHDAAMDIRAPSHALTRAHAVVRARRLISARSPGWALGPDGLRALTGRAGFVDPESGGRGGQGRAAGGAGAGQGRFEGDEKAGADAVASGPENPADADPLAHEFAAIDAVLARAAKMLDGGQVTAGLAGPAGNEAGSRRDQNDRPARSALLYEPDGDEQARLADWQAGLAQSAGLPAVLRAALALEAWADSAVLPQAPGLGALLAAALLRQDGLTQTHLASLNFGAQKIPRARRRARARPERVLALLDALGEAARAGLAEHDRLVLAKTRMARRLADRRASSKLPQLIDLVLARPLVSTSMIQQALAVSRQGALNLVAELNLREMTGRGRYKAWGVV